MRGVDVPLGDGQEAGRAGPRRPGGRSSWGRASLRGRGSRWRRACESGRPGSRTPSPGRARSRGRRSPEPSHERHRTGGAPAVAAGRVRKLGERRDARPAVGSNRTSARSRSWLATDRRGRFRPDQELAPRILAALGRQRARHVGQASVRAPRARRSGAPVRRAGGGPPATAAASGDGVLELPKRQRLAAPIVADGARRLRSRVRGHPRCRPARPSSGQRLVDRSAGRRWRGSADARRGCRCRPWRRTWARGAGGRACRTSCTGDRGIAPAARPCAGSPPGVRPCRACRSSRSRGP